MVLSDVRVPSHLPLLLLSRFPSVAYSSDYLGGRSSHYNQGPDYETAQLQNFRSINYVAFSKAQERAGYCLLHTSN
ncbi:hypothetical protein HYE67_008339 [Fusarium culmorum]|uniref:Uncharacterized protein n=1 Tax=Fusarium culmorum TaxID=5516 RepID=A0A2T4H8P8_FUSCU|nr:hypothetical protein FCULG_00003030 [Fusarium culmorum]QPC66108.1 hypothetical protein HYE67_008339 [Fusarium culmorum]